MSWNRTQEDNRQAQELEAAKQRYNQSEWTLNILRTQTANPITPATDEEILLWNKQLNSNPK